MGAVIKFFKTAVSSIAYTLLDLVSFTKIITILLLWKLFQVVDWGMALFKETMNVPASWYYMVVVLGTILATMLGGYVYINKMDKAVSAVVKLWKETKIAPTVQEDKTQQIIVDEENVLRQTFKDNSSKDVVKQNASTI